MANGSGTGVTRLRAEGVVAPTVPLESVRVQMPAEVPDDAPEPSVAVLSRVMADAPMDGRRLWLENEDGAQFEGYWRVTREFLRGEWVPKSFWALWNTKTPLPFEPVGWIEAKGL